MGCCWATPGCCVGVRVGDVGEERGTLLLPEEKPPPPELLPPPALAKATVSRATKKRNRVARNTAPYLRQLLLVTTMKTPL
jgi:hypothetical protein